MGKEVWKPIDGTVVNWDDEVQVNPATGETYDFDGNPITEQVPDETPTAKIKGKKK